MYRLLTAFFSLLLAATFCCGSLTDILATETPEIIDNPSAIATQPPAIAQPTESSIQPTAIPTQSVEPTAPPDDSAWLQGAALPLDSLEPLADDDFSDLMPLKELIGDARVVGLGEATHGTHEFFTMKDRLLRFLVQEMGFNFFAIEDAWGEANHINDYIFGYTQDLDTLMYSGITYWTWRTEEVKTMVEWMRALNDDPSTPLTVGYAGIDCNQDPLTSIEMLLGYLEVLDPDYLPQAQTATACIGQEGSFYDLRDASSEVQQTCLIGLQEVYDYITSMEEVYISATSQIDFEILKQASRNIVQTVEVSFSSPSSTLRDQYMAENLIWWLNFLGPDSKIVLWAHNGHVSKADPDQCYSCSGLGHFLDQALGQEYYVIGFAFDQGDFQASGVKDDVWSDVVPQNLPSAPEGTLTWKLRQTGLGEFMLPLDNLPPEADWLRQPVQFWDVGSAVWLDSLEYNLTEETLPDHFDLLIYIENTTAARPVQ
jgi:erythromycin esterase